MSGSAQFEVRSKPANNAADFCITTSPRRRRAAPPSLQPSAVILVHWGELEPVGERIEFLQGVLKQRARGSSNADIARLDCRE